MKKSKRYSWLSELVDHFSRFLLPSVMYPPVSGNFNDLLKIINEQNSSREKEDNLQELDLIEQLLLQDLDVMDYEVEPSKKNGTNKVEI